jgi:hypothetical protein
MSSQSKKPSGKKPTSSKPVQKSRKPRGRQFIEPNQKISTDPTPADTLSGFKSQTLIDVEPAKPQPAANAGPQIYQLDKSDKYTDRFSADYLCDTESIQDVYKRRYIGACEKARSTYHEITGLIVSALIDDPNLVQFHSAPLDELAEDVFAAVLHIAAAAGWTLAWEERVITFMLDQQPPIALLNAKQSPR